MRMLFSVFHQPTVLGQALCLLAATALIGCASKNPLMEEPVAASAPTAKPAASTAPAPVASTPTASAPAANVPAPGKTSEAAPVKTAEAAPAKNDGAVNSDVQTSGSHRLFGFLSPYRIDVQQGNFISREMVAQLKPGMTPDQVRFALGTPLLTDIFHADRWDYVFRLKKGNGEIISSKIAVFFKDNRLDRIDGGHNLPTEKDYLALIAGSTPPPATPATPAAGNTPATK